jgi:hypothetical protein
VQSVSLEEVRLSSSWYFFPVRSPWSPATTIHGHEVGKATSGRVRPLHLKSSFSVVRVQLLLFKILLSCVLYAYWRWVKTVWVVSCVVDAEMLGRKATQRDCLPVSWAVDMLNIASLHRSLWHQRGVLNMAIWTINVIVQICFHDSNAYPERECCSRNPSLACEWISCYCRVHLVIHACSFVHDLAAWQQHPSEEHLGHAMSWWELIDTT